MSVHAIEGRSRVEVSQLPQMVRKVHLPQKGHAIDSIGVRRPPCRSPCSRARTEVWGTVADQAGVVEGTGEGCLQTPYVNHVLSTTRSCVGTPLGRGLDTRGDREFQEL